MAIPENACTHFFFHVQRHGVGQVLLEKIGSFLQSIDLILLRATEEIFEAENFFQRHRCPVTVRADMK